MNSDPNSDNDEQQEKPLTHDSKADSGAVVGLISNGIFVCISIENK
jgi:hypothetical protein